MRSFKRSGRGRQFRTIQRPRHSGNVFAIEALETRCMLAAGSVVINEINYNPPDKTKPLEFVELFNPGDTAVNLGNATFINGIHYTFPIGTMLGAGGYLVVAENPTALQQAYGVSSLGPWTGSLTNQGEDITIADALGNPLDDVNYGGGFPWPTIGDSPGPGYSIQLVNPSLDNSLGGNWRSYVPSPQTQVTLIAKNSTWEYRKGTAEATPSPNAVGAWRGLDYVEDSNWKSGQGPIGYVPAGGPTMRTTLSDMSGSYSSVFMRKTFYIPDPAEALGLTLQAIYDDGFKVWINGRLAQVVNAPNPTTDDTPFSGLASSARAGSIATYSNFTLNPTFLQAGDNEIAIQFFNIAKTDTDAFFDAALIETSGTGGPTPSRQNSVFATNAAPAMRQVNVNPQMPAPNTPATITVKVTDPDGVASVALSYQTVDAGNYIGVQDAAYTNPANWATVAMHDDGLNGDAMAGDGIFTVVLPASVQVNRRLVRYKITATDGLDASITGPYADDPVPNLAYYIYAGVPAYSGALQPGASGSAGQVQTFSTATMTSLPVLQLITKNQDHINSQHLPGSNSPASTGNEYSFAGTLVYNGVVYDNIHYRARGGVWRYAMGKNMWKIDFQNGHDFQAYYPDGTPYPTLWKKLDLGAMIQQGNIGDRGEQGLFETLGFQLFNLAGVPGSATIPATFRIVENASENGGTQYATDFQGLYLMVEEPDGRFLDAHGLPDGNFYKMEGGSGTSKNQGPTQPSDGSDLAAFIAALNANPTEQWLRDNVDLNSFYSFQAVTELIHNWDIGFGKNYLYYHNPDTNKWSIIPWDLDLTWYVNYEPSNGNITPFASAILSKPNLQIEYRNRVRELQDLLFSPEQIGKLADAYANPVNPQGAGPTLVQADAAMWNYNPIETSSSVNLSKANVGLFWQNGSPTKDFPGMVARLKSFATTRLTYLNNTIITLADDAAAPQRPSFTYTGAAGFPINSLTFSTGAFAAGSSGGTFAGMEWRIADVTNQSILSPSIESNAVWDSGFITTFGSTVSVPSNIGLLPGHVYRVRVRTKDSNGRWSHWSNVAAGASQFVANAPSNLVQSSLRITESNYNPSNPPAGSPFGTQDFEYIELQNFGSQTINLAGVQFTNGIDYTFGNVSLAPGQVGVLVKRTAAFQSRYGPGALILGDYESTGQNFSNGGEHVELVDAFAQPIADFSYVDSWYPSTDGGGATLEVINPFIAPDLNDAANWRASATVNGTPGIGSTAALPAPTGAVATSVSSTQVSLQWVNNATTELGYRIYRRTNGSAFTQIADLASNSTTYTDNNGGAGLIPGVQYDYLIQAYNAAGFSDGAAVSVSTPTAAPINLTGAPGGGSVALSWSVPVGAVTYNVYHGSTSGGESPTPLATNLALPNFTDLGVPTAGNLYYVVTAVNVAGLESTASAEAVVFFGASNQYSFEEGAGTATIDSAAGNNGTLVGATPPTWSAGRIGNGALDFSGTGVYNQTNQSAVQTTNNLATSLGATSTLVVWVKTTQTGNNTHWQAPAITGVEQSGGTSDINWGTLNASGRIGIYIGDTGGVYSTNPVNDGQWHNIALTRDAGTGVVQVYVDGVLNGSATLTTGNKTSQFFLIGALSDVASNGTTFTGANFFNGSLDDLRIYNRVLTVTEIASLSIIPSTPTSLSATAVSASTVQLAWNNVSNFANNVEVMRKIGAGGIYSQVALLSGAATSFTDTGRTASTQYIYKIRALNVAGASSFTTDVSVTPPHPTVAGRSVFYNGSAFDDEIDSNSIAVDKQLLLPGQTATFANYSSYAKGINGIMLDLTNFDGQLSATDFTFRVGNTNDPTTWQAAPDPQFVLALPGAGIGGSTRVELAWNDGAIANQWLQVTVKANSNTQLNANDVFYFGNAIGDSGNSATDANVNSSDVLGARGHQMASPVSIINAWDYNRDAVVNALDAAIAQQHITAGAAALQLITAPSAGGGGSSAEVATSAANVSTALPMVASVSTTPVTSTLLASNWFALSRLPSLTQPISVIANPIPAVTGTAPPEKTTMKFGMLQTADQRQRDRLFALRDKVLGEFNLWELPTLES